MLLSQLASDGVMANNEKNNENKRGKLNLSCVEYYGKLLLK